MSKTVTPLQAFQHFLKHCPKPIPKRVQEAKYCMMGKRDGYSLTEARIKNILTTYAPDKYEFRDVVLILE